MDGNFNLSVGPLLGPLLQVIDFHYVEKVNVGNLAQVVAFLQSQE